MWMKNSLPALGAIEFIHGSILFDSKEAFAHISLVRLGAHLGYFDADVMQKCDGLMMEIQPAHLQLFAGKELEPEKRDKIRAEIIRDQLQSLDPPATSNLEKQNNSIDDTEDQLPIE